MRLFGFCSLVYPRLLLLSYQVTPDSCSLWAVAYQAPLSMGFPRQEYRSGLLFPFPGNLPNPGIEFMSPAWQMDSLPLSHLGSQPDSPAHN